MFYKCMQSNIDTCVDLINARYFHIFYIYVHNSIWYFIIEFNNLIHYIKVVSNYCKNKKVLITLKFILCILKVIIHETWKTMFQYMTNEIFTSIANDVGYMLHLPDLRGTPTVSFKKIAFSLDISILCSSKYSNILVLQWF